MKSILIVTLTMFFGVPAFSYGLQDSVKVDRVKAEAIVKEIEKRFLENYHKIEMDFDLRDVEFVYPNKFIPKNDFDFGIEVKWKGETILLCDVEVDDKTYKLGSIIDLR